MPNSYFDDSERVERVLKFIDSWTNPHGYYVDAQTLATQIGKVSGVQEKFKQQILEILWLIEIPPNSLVDSLQLGMNMWSIGRNLGEEELKQFSAIESRITQLKYVPFVNIRGNKVQ